MARYKFPRFRFRLIVAEEYQPVESIPKLSLLSLWLIIMLALAAQLAFGISRPTPTASAISLPPAPSELTMNALAVGDKVTFGKAASLWLQAFDNQQGQSISFYDLDYNKVVDWLRAIVHLDERAQYPLFTAVQIYTFIGNPQRKLIMCEFAREQFLRDPANRWQWMAYATTIVKNDVKDLDLAIEYAKELRENTEGLANVPNWAKQMEPLLRSDNNEFETSATMLLQLLESGKVTDPHEFRLLYDRLEETFTDMIEAGKVSQEQYLKMEEMFERVRNLYLELNLDS